MMPVDIVRQLIMLGNIMISSWMPVDILSQSA